MRKLSMTTFASLDGVAQAPGGPNEDKSGDFELGGWTVPYWTDDDMGRIMTEWFEPAGGFVLGRKTYEIFAAHWPQVGDADPVAKSLNALPKYVASRTLAKVDWKNSTLLQGDVATRIAELKREPGGELQVHGSIDLAQTLMRRGLVDVYRLWVFPVVLGSGRRLFRDGFSAALRLRDSVTMSSGVVVQTYEPAGAVQLGSFEL